MLLYSLCGDDCFSIDIVHPLKRASVAQYLRDTNSWLECVEGMRCVVVKFDAASVDWHAAEELLSNQLASSTARARLSESVIEIPVCYGGDYGPEFESICEMFGLTGDELIDIHTSKEHRVDLIGFTPGFAYLSGLDEDLHVPRLSDPRQRVEAGSIGIAAGLTGVYALAGPGGWPLLGRTPLALFEPDEPQPFLLQTGTHVRFSAIDDITFRRMVAP
ncbi:MAG: 5-oxoprolinase subunit PxpB [Woeseiaceae bacterium]